MGVGKMKFDLDRFKESVQKGLFLPNDLAYGYVDEAKFERYQQELKWKEGELKTTFEELRQRMSRCYFKNVVLAQTCALDYAALNFPAYSMLISEDLAEDWLAIVDYHKKFSRDHSLHQPLTAYIAASLLGYGNANASLAIPASPGNLLDFCVDAIFTSAEATYIKEMAARYGIPMTMLDDTTVAREFWKGLFYRTVVLSALFHDIGYPWQYVDRIGAALRKNVGILHPTDTTVLNIVDNFKERMVMLPLRHYQMLHVNEPVNEDVQLRKLTESALATHGFPGAIAFLSLNDTIRKYPSKQPMALLHEFSVEWAAMGIFMHDMAGKHKKVYPKLRVNILQDPLSVIISMADYLEEFNRPKVQFKPKSRQSRMRYYSDCSAVEVICDDEGTLKVRMKYISDASKAIAAAFKKEETEDYFTPGTGYVDLAPMGIRKVVYEQE